MTQDNDGGLRVVLGPENLTFRQLIESEMKKLAPNEQAPLSTLHLAFDEFVVKLQNSLQENIPENVKAEIVSIVANL